MEAAAVDKKPNGGPAAGDAQLLSRIRKMGFHGDLGDAQLMRDFASLQVPSYTFQALPFFGAEQVQHGHSTNHQRGIK